MQFPAPSETFASNDIKALCSLGYTIDVFSMKNKHTQHKELIKERDLNNLDIYCISKKEFFIGILECLKKFLLFVNLFIWIVKSDYKRPLFLIKILAFIPSSFYILKQLEKTKPDIIHLFWGHYPSLVAYLVKNRLPKTKISIFLGAYDLAYSLGISKYICNIADYIFTHTKINIPALMKMGVVEEKINVVYRGTVVSFENTRNTRNTKIAHSFCSGGRLLKAKNFDNVIDVFHTYQKSFPDARLKIFGDGPEKLNLMEHVNILGFIII